MAGTGHPAENFGPIQVLHSPRLISRLDLEKLSHEDMKHLSKAAC
jgi:hypothetical protein